MYETSLDLRDIINPVEWEEDVYTTLDRDEIEWLYW